jgi:hypothetical protein
MTEIFKETSDSIAEEFGFTVNKKEQQNTIAYLKELHDRQKDYL